MKTVRLIPFILVFTAARAEPRIPTAHVVHWCAGLMSTHSAGSPYAGNSERSLNEVAGLVREALPKEPARIVNPFDAMSRILYRGKSFRLADVRDRLRSVVARGRLEKLAADLDTLERDASGLRPDVIAFGQVFKGRDAIVEYIRDAADHAGRFERAKWLIDEPYWRLRRVALPLIAIAIGLPYFTPLAEGFRHALAEGQVYDTIGYGTAVFADTMLLLQTVPRVIYYVLGLKLEFARNIYEGYFSGTSSRRDLTEMRDGLSLVTNGRNSRPLAYASRRLVLQTEVVDRMLDGNGSQGRPGANVPEPATAPRPVDLAAINFREVLLDQFFLRADDGEPVLMSFVRIKRIPPPDQRKPPGNRRTRDVFEWITGGPKPAGQI